MGYNPNIRVGEVVNSDTIYSEFQCQRYKGIMYSRANNALVLISDRVKAVYQDRWDENDILYYTGTGKVGNQVLDESNGNNNKKLAYSRENGIELFLFERFVDKEYLYRGKVELIKDYYIEKQNDVEGNLRNVYVFPLGLIEKSELGKEILDENQNKSIKKARRRKDEELRRIINGKKNKHCSVRNISTIVYERNQDVVELVKRRAKGKCELCGEEAPFKDKYGYPYLESHHVVWLSKGGEDSEENSLALCPNCHKKMHIVNNRTDVKKLLSRLHAYQKNMNV